MLKTIIINKFLSMFENLKKKENNEENGIFIRVNNENKELEAYLFKDGKKDRKLTIDDLLNLMK